jgi:hypothetical protein
MMACVACGAILIFRDGEWICSSFVANPTLHTILTHRSDEYSHALRNPATIKDKRIGISA